MSELFIFLLSEIKWSPILGSIFTLFFLYLLIFIFWQRIFRSFKFLIKYNGIQRVHDGEIPRLGGFISVIGLCVFYLLSDLNTLNVFLSAVIISSIPIVIISIKEDLFHNTNAKTRLILMFVSSILFFLIYPIDFPSFESNFISDFFSKFFISSFIFFSFSVVIIMNGNNLIDGMNGLMPSSCITQCLCLLYLCFVHSDYENMINLIPILMTLLIFFFFNYPFGKIFMGDTGSYFFGFLIANQTIIFFGDNPDVPTWNAVLILIYPSLELLISIIRRLIRNKDPLEPDINHLHIKIYRLLKLKNISISLSNNFVMPILFLVWGLPLISLIYFNNDKNLIIISILFICCIYLLYFLYSSSKLKMMLNKN